MYQYPAHPNPALKLDKPYYYGGAGNAGTPPDVSFIRRQRQRMNLVAVCQCLFIPWISFCVVYALTGFSFHYNRPLLCWIVVGLYFPVFLFITWWLDRCTGKGIARSLASKQRSSESAEPSWFVFLFVTMLIAVVLGATLGSINFHSFMQKYYDYKNLNSYKDVDVSKTTGVQLMDAARVNFLEGSVLDLRKAMGFKNLNTYCVAPITVTNKDKARAELTNYDFWAVGMDCCSSDMSDFHCGEYNNPNAKGGLRLLEDDERSFYRLAVQQAQALYHVKSTHPLFFYWTADPAKETESWRDEGYKFFFLGMLVHFCWQMLCVGLAVLGFGKMGHY